jgi:hypothetical protein
VEQVERRIKDHEKEAGGSLEQLQAAFALSARRMGREGRDCRQAIATYEVVEHAHKLRSKKLNEVSKVGLGLVLSGRARADGAACGCPPCGCLPGPPPALSWPLPAPATPPGLPSCCTCLPPLLPPACSWTILWRHWSTRSSGTTCTRRSTRWVGGMDQSVGEMDRWVGGGAAGARARAWVGGWAAVGWVDGHLGGCRRVCHDAGGAADLRLATLASSHPMCASLLAL